MSSQATERTVATEYRVGQLVEVRSAEEIMATLDQRAELDAMPFMPEMLRFCGTRLRVVKIANKTCDTMQRTGMRRMTEAVHLEGARCDGAAHGGCQADCLLYFKHAWVRPVTDGDAPAAPGESDGRVASGADPAAGAAAGAAAGSAVASAAGSGAGSAAAEVPALLAAATTRPSEDDEPRYRCQATELLRAAPQGLPLRKLDQYAEDLRTGNATLAETARTLAVGLFDRYQHLSRRRFPAFLRVRGGLPWGFLRGYAGKTPTVQTDLQPGELVRVKSKQEIMATLNKDLLNRGMGFDPEMARYCGRVGRVSRRVDRILDEKTGRMLQMKNPCIVLEGFYCRGAFNQNCPRSIPQYWREIWLERVESRQ